MIQRNKGKRLSRYMADYVVFDLETTGINQERDEIIEVLLENYIETRLK